MNADVAIIGRSEWGARYADGFGAAPVPAGEVWLHHSATLAPDVLPPFEDDDAAIRAIEQIGQDRFGGGISYTWLITPAGLVFQGHSPDREGAHTLGHNVIGRGICWVGNYEQDQPTERQVQATAWLLQHARTQGWIQHARLTGGHRDVREIECPGQHAYDLIAHINELAGGEPIPEVRVPRIMYDSVTAADIPATARIVAGYVNGRFAWSAADWVRFPNAVKVRIATQASVNDGHVLDVEPGDATPEQAPGWVAMRRRAGVDPTVYCNQLNGWAAVRQAFRDQGVPEPHYWVARYDNNATIPAGAVAKQYANPTVHGLGHFDLSTVADYWPGVDQPQEADMLTPDDGNTEWAAADPDTGIVETHEVAHWMAIPAYRTGRIQAELRALAAKVDAGFGALSDDEAHLLAAIRAQPTGGQVDVPALAAALGRLGTLVARVPDDQIQQLLAEIDKMPAATRQQLAAALGRTA